MPIYVPPPVEESSLKRAAIFIGKSIVAAAFLFGAMAIVAVIGMSLDVGR